MSTTQAARRHQHIYAGWDSPLGELLRPECILAIPQKVAFLCTGLPEIGFAIALLWIVLRAVLGEKLDASVTGDALKDLSAALVLVALGVAHGLVLRRDLRLAGAGAEPLRIIALLAPNAEETLAALRGATATMGTHR